MKKILALLGGILLISALSVPVFSSCDKDTWSYLEVTVLDQSVIDSVTKQHPPVPGALVRVARTVANNGNGGSPIDTRGVCDENGVCKLKFGAPAIFVVQGRIAYHDPVNPNTPYFRQGVSSVRLKEAQTMTDTVYITSQTIRGDIDNWEYPALNI